MRSSESRHILVVVLALAIANAAMLVSCASDSPTRSYQTIGAINEAVQAGVRAFGVIYNAKKIENPELWAARYDQVSKAYSKYQAVALVAAEAASTYGETKSLVAVMRESADEVLNLLMEFGVKVK